MELNSSTTNSSSPYFSEEAFMQYCEIQVSADHSREDAAQARLISAVCGAMGLGASEAGYVMIGMSDTLPKIGGVALIYSGAVFVVGTALSLTRSMQDYHKYRHNQRIVNRIAND